MKHLSQKLTKINAIGTPQSRWQALGVLLFALLATAGTARFVHSAFAQSTMPPFTRVQYRMQAPQPSDRDQFGNALDMERSGSQNYAIVGAPNAEGSGRAYVWEELGNGRDWRIDRAPVGASGTITTVGVLSGTDSVAGDRFGVAVAMSRNFAVVGAPAHDQPQTDAGAAYIFDRLDTDEEDAKKPWSQQYRLTANDLTVGDGFGSSVDIWGRDDMQMTDSSGRAVVGAPRRSAGGGAAYFYDFDTLGSLTSLRLQPNPAPSLGDEFGESVAVYQNLIFVGAPWAEGTGVVYVFSYDASTATIQQLNILRANDGSRGDQFGQRIDVAENGGMLAVSAINYDVESAANVGAVYLYERNGASFDFLQRLTASDFSIDARFGYGIAFGRGNGFSRNGLIVGDNNAMAYYFRRNGTTWEEYRRLRVLGLPSDSQYGRSVGFVAGRIGVGALSADVSLSNGGSAADAGYVYIHNVLTGTLTIEKDTQPDNRDASWEISINGASPFNTTLNGDGSIGATNVINGLYIISESAVEGTDENLYTPSYLCTVDEPGREPITFDSNSDADPSDIAVRVNRAANVVCTFTNAANQSSPASLRIVNDVTPDAANTSWVIAVEGPTPFGETVSGDAGTTPQSVAPGTYSVSEMAAQGTRAELYNAQYSCAVNGVKFVSGAGRNFSVEVAEAQNVTCTITNVRKPTLQIVNNVVPDGDGSSWRFEVSGPTTFESSLADGSTDKKIVAPGAYTIVESIVSDGDGAAYTSEFTCTADGADVAADASRTANLTIEASQDVVCRFNNTRVDSTVGTLIIQKNVVPNANQARWTFDIEGPTASTVTVAGDGSSTFEVAPGSYTITESDANVNLEDYSTNVWCGGTETTESREVTIDVAVGETVNCVFTNTSTVLVTPPTRRPTPANTPVPMNTPLPTATLDPGEIPAPTNTPLPTATLRSGETPLPTATLQLGETPPSTATLQSGKTPLPTATLRPSATPSPTATLQAGETPPPLDGRLFLPLISNKQ